VHRRAHQHLPRPPLRGDDQPPTFDKQLENLRRFQGFGGTERLPGTHEAADRFVRAAYDVTQLPAPKSQREAVASIMSVMRNVSAPFGLADPSRPNISTTIWRSGRRISTASTAPTCSG
jgi:choloylglycine hydrolase